MKFTKFPEMGITIAEFENNYVFWTPSCEFLSVKYDGVCSYIVPNDEYRNNYSDLESLNEAELAVRFKQLIQKALDNDPFKVFKDSMNKALR